MFSSPDSLAELPHRIALARHDSDGPHLLASSGVTAAVTRTGCGRVNSAAPVAKDKRSLRTMGLVLIVFSVVV